MAYSSVGQSAEVLADELAALLPVTPTSPASSPWRRSPSRAPPTTCRCRPRLAAPLSRWGPAQPRLIVFFATWLSEVSDLKSELTGANAYVTAAKQDNLPQLVAVDETVVEPSAQSVRSYLNGLGTPLDYPVGSTPRAGSPTATASRTSPGSCWPPPPARSSGRTTAGCRYRPSPPPSSTP